MVSLKNQKKVLTTVYFLTFIALGLVAGALGPSIPSFAKNTATELSKISSMFIFSAFGYVMGSYLAGILFHKFPGNKVLAGVLVCMSTGIALLPIVHSLWILVALIFLVGMAQSNLDVGENALIVWLHGSKVAPYMNGLHFFFGIGSFIAPLIIAQSLKGTQTINLAFWIFAILILLPIPFLLRLDSPKNPDHVQPSHDTPTRPKASRATVVLLIIFFLFFSGGEITFSNWIYTHSLKTGFASVESAAYLTSTFWGTFMLGRLLGVVVSRYLSNRLIIWVDLLGGITSLVIMLIFPHSAAVLWVFSGFFGLFVATGFPTGMNLAGELNAVTARITSLIFTASSVSVMISPWIVGQFIERPNNQALIWVVLINISLAAVAMQAVQFSTRRDTQAALQPKEILPRSGSTD
jgi:FHS family Na+ dependent glucose MFS transporter 1